MTSSKHCTKLPLEAMMLTFLQSNFNVCIGHKTFRIFKIVAKEVFRSADLQWLGQIRSRNAWKCPEPSTICFLKKLWLFSTYLGISGRKDFFLNYKKQENF